LSKARFIAFLHRKCPLSKNAYLVINLANLPDDLMDSLDKYGTLKAALLAMRYVKSKQFLKLHFEEIFLFLQQHPEKKVQPKL
jgi:hypothetical protein